MLFTSILIAKSYLLGVGQLKFNIQHNFHILMIVTRKLKINY